MTEPEAAARRLQRPKPLELDGLIRQALERKGLAAAAAARLAGITPSNLSRAMSGTRSLPRAKLATLADILGLARSEVLRAAGHMDSVDIDLPAVIPIQPAPAKLKVVTDPRFLDSALFWWIFSKQPFQSVGVECVLEKESWPMVPARVAGYRLAIGFFNKQIPRLELLGAPAYDVRHWADLCLYKGYSLIGRQDHRSGKKLQRLANLDDARAFLRRLRERARAEGRRPVVLTIGGDTETRFKTPLTPEIDDFQFLPFPTADQALQRFLEGAGDCFSGGLPQRLMLNERPYIEILHFDNNPYLFSINSLICSPAAFDQRRELLHTASALWFETVHKLRDSADYRQQVAADVIRLLEDEGEHHSLSTDFFEDVFGPYGETYETFADRPGALADSVLDAMQRVFENTKSPNFSKAFEHVKEALTAPSATTSEPAQGIH